MPVVKLSVSVDAQLAEQARRLAERAGVPLSAVVDAALEREVRLAALREAVEGYEAEAGAITDEERQASRARLGL